MGRQKRSWVAVASVITVLLGTVVLWPRQEAHADANSVRGFEGQGWTTTAGTLAYGPMHTQGAQSLELRGVGYAELKTQALGPVTFAAGAISFDVMLPPPANPSYAGQVQVYVTSPSRTLTHAFVGQKDLQGLMSGVWQTISIPIPANVASSLTGTVTDATVGIAVNLPTGSGVVRFDNLRFGDEGTLPPDPNRVAAEILDRTLKMEFTADWTVSPTGTLGSVDRRTGGDAALAAAGIRGFTRIASRRLSTLPAVTGDVGFDLLLPSSLATESPSWFGQAQLFVEAPSVGLFNAPLGAVELTGLPLNTFRSIRFKVPADVAGKLRQPYTDLFFTIVLNVPQSSTGTFILDELRFLSAAAAVPSTALNREPGRRPQETLGLDPATGRVTILPIAGGWGQPTTVDIPAAQGATAACSADFDGDGSADILFGNPTTRRLGWIGRRAVNEPVYGVGTVHDVDVSAPSGRVGPMACDDIDGDGDVDVVTSFSGQTVGTLLPTLALVSYVNDGHGVFTRSVFDSGVQRTGELAGKSLGDFNHDGKLDLALFAADSTLASTAQVFLFSNTGSATQPFTTSARTAVNLPPDLLQSNGPNWGALTAVDFNRDGNNDLWVLGNNGNLFAVRGKGNLTFDPALPAGAVDVSRLRPELNRRDVNGDGLPDLLVGVWSDLLPNLSTGDRALATTQLNRLGGVIWIPSRGDGVIVRVPTQLGGGGPALLPGTYTSTRLEPGFPAAGAIGLIKGTAAVSSIVNSDGVTVPSTFFVAVNGHLVQRVEQMVTTVTTVVAPAPATQFPAGTIVLGGAEACGGTCGIGRVCTGGLLGGVCRALPSGSVTTSVSTQQRLIWIDHGTPRRTILDGTPAVLSGETGAKLVRRVVVRGLDGHAYSIDPDYANNANLGNSGWTDLGLPPPVAASDGPAPPTSLEDSNFQGIEGAQRKLHLRASHDHATAGIRPRFTGSPTVVQGPLGGDAFMLDTLGRLQQISIFDGRIFNRGTPPNDGPLGDGSPRAISWFGPDNLLHVEVYLVDARHRPSYLEMTTNDFQTGGSWAWRALHPPVTDPGVAIPSDFFEQFMFSSLGLRGTPDVVASRDKSGVLHRFVAIRAAGGFYVGDVTGGIEGRTLATGARMLKSPLTIHAGDQDHSIAPESDPRFMYAGTTQSIVGISNFRRLIGVTGDFFTLATDPFTWNDYPPAPNVNGIEDTVSAVPSLPPFSVLPHLSIVRTDGTLVDGDIASPSQIGWHDVHREPGTPQVLSAQVARDQQCKDSGLTEETVFPQWVSGPTFPGEAVRNQRGQRPAGSPLADQALYPNNDFNHGFQADKPRTMTGFVVHSRQSPLDNPFNHTQVVRQLPNPLPTNPSNMADRTVVTHDWNAKVAPDIAHQYLMSEGNIQDNGLVEIEWEQEDDKWNIDALPVEGDLLAVRGRHIFDCGHPPYKTEIHPPTAAAVVHDNTARIVFSTKGGPNWFQPTDQLLPTGARCNLASGFGEVVDSIDFWEAVDLAKTFFLGCGRGFDLSHLSYEHFCYVPYEHTMTDVLGDNEPLEFDVPLPSFASVDAQPTLSISAPGQTSGVSVSLIDAAPRRWHVRAAPENMPSAGITFLRASYSPDPGPGLDDSTVEVCFKRNQISRHDNYVPASGFRSFVEDINVLSPIPSPGEILTDAIVHFVCGKDDVTDEPVMFFGSNGKWVQKAPWRESPSQCVTADLVPGDIDELRIRSHGYECDVSCGETPDDDIVEAPDDVEGEVDVLFTRDDIAINPGSTTPRVFQVLSQPHLSTDAQRLRTFADYSLAFSVANVIRGTPP